MQIVQGRQMDIIHIEISWKEAFNAICNELDMGYELELNGSIEPYNDNGMLCKENDYGSIRRITDDPEKIVLHQALDIIRRQLKLQERRLKDAE